MIESVIALVTQDLGAGAGDDLSGFCSDAELALRRSTWAAQHSIRTREVPTCSVDVDAVLAHDVDSLQAIAAHLRDLWSELAYQAFEASSVQRYRSATVLRFVTANLRAGYSFSGRIRVSGGPYAELAEAFERRFHPLEEEPSPTVGPS